GLGVAILLLAGGSLLTNWVAVQIPGVFPLDMRTALAGVIQDVNSRFILWSGALALVLAALGLGLVLLGRFIGGKQTG
ncbi:MAG: hypothetical protein GYA17_16810, partial [Chloroflexi bacterium]|nr:hypothetical protein [Chloroflexota bacterium]